jgi:hypothetical protein
MLRGFAAFGTLAVIATFTSAAVAQPAPVPVRLVQGSDGALYVVQGSSSWTVVPDQIGDEEVAALSPTGEIDGTFPSELFVVQAPPVVAPVPAGPATNPPAGSSAPAWQGATEMWATDWGQLTITYGGKGSWLQGGSTGEITSSKYDPASRVVTFTYYQTWNKQEGEATLTIALGGQGFNGTWQQRTLGTSAPFGSGGKGTWSGTRAMPSVLVQP